MLLLSQVLAGALKISNLTERQYSGQWKLFSLLKTPQQVCIVKCSMCRVWLVVDVEPVLISIYGFFFTPVFIRIYDLFVLTW